MQSVVDTLELPMQAYTDVLLQAEWREMTAVTAYFAAVDPNTCAPLNPLTPIYPGRGPALLVSKAHSFGRTFFTSFTQCVEDVARGRQVREVMMALTNFEDDASWVPLQHMWISSIRHLELWGATMDDDLRRHLLDSGYVWVQVILRATAPPPPQLPPPPPGIWTSSAGGASWEVSSES